MRRPLVLLIALLLAAAASSRAAGAESFLWEQANASIARASSPEDFLASARLYRQLLDRDASRPLLLQNYGTALLLAERPAEALDAYLRAERLSGTTPDLLHDIRAAYAAQEEGATPPWYRSVLPWHYRLPVRIRILVAAVCWIVFCLSLTPFGVRRLRRALLVLSLLGFALFASSSALSLHASSAPLPPIPEIQPSQPSPAPIP